MSPEADQPMAAGAAPAALAETTPAAANMLAHISMRGNVLGRVGEWLGEPGSGLGIEALMLAPATPGPAHLNPVPEYQLLYKDGLRTPWTPAGQLCGSAGIGLAIQGLRFRLNPDSVGFFDCRYDVAFSDGSRHEDLPGAEEITASAGATVEAVRLHIRPRAEPMPLIVLNDIAVDHPPTWKDTDRADDQTIRLRLASPAFGTQRPTIRNEPLTPAQSRNLMELSFSRAVFPPRSVTFRIVENALVMPEGIAFDPDLTILAGTERLHSEETVAACQAAARQARGSNPRRITGLTVLCTGAAAHNYGHFLMEMFPKAWLGTRLFGQRVPSYLVRSNDLLPIVQEAFANIGINPFAVMTLDRAPVECEALIVIDGLTEHGVYQSPLCLQAIRSLAERVPAAPYRKLFIPRASPQRALKNQDAVEALMRERDFTIADPGRFSLVEQIALFKGASTIVGPLGAALTNAAFSPRGAHVVALTPQSFPDTFFWFLCQHAGHRYEEIRGLDATGQPDAENSWNEGFSLSEDDLAYLATL